MTCEGRYLRQLVPALVILALGSGSRVAAAHIACPDYRGPLATAEQISAEGMAARIADSPEVKTLRPTLRKVLEADPAARLPDGAATIERAIAERQISIQQQVAAKYAPATSTPRRTLHLS